MSGTLSLNGTWGLTWAEGSPLMTPGYYTGPTLDGRKTFDAEVPCPVHKVLLDRGMIEDPNLGLNSLKARWVEEMFWIYRRTVDVPAEAAEQNAWLVFERLEYNAIVWLNGEEVGRHQNAHRPARFNVTGKLRAGGLAEGRGDLLVVQLDTGMHSASEKSATEYQMAEIELLTKRHWHRKAQYQSGWDWNARLMNVGILGDARLEWTAGPRLDQVTVYAVPTADLSSARFTIRATVEGLAEMQIDAVLRARIVETGQEATLPITIAPGEGRHELSIDVENPTLWWPIHHGEQFRYTVEISLDCGGETQSVTRRTGVRRVEIDQSPHPVEGQYFIVTINNRPVFCKGGNWVPADLLYSTVTAERYRDLVGLAVGANFNMLRIWGGAIFADHAMLDACDEAGVLVWHDFLFACAKYPGDDPAFAAEVRREVTWAVRDMAHHPSLVVWCGNNEIEWGDWAWGYDGNARSHPHYAIFHHDIPSIVLNEDPSTRHWISSPYSPDYKYPNDPTVGDQHPWGVSIQDPGPPDWWKYRAYVDRFPNEGGVLGATSPATLRQFLPEGERKLLSPTWDHHDNPMGCLSHEQGALGRAYQTVEFWTGIDPLSLDLEKYAYVSGLLHAEGLTEYITNYRRRMFSSSSAIFWMYNDSWPVTHGWTIVDYYLRKKLAYHPVRRAFAPVTVVVAEEGGEVTIYGVNDTPTAWTGQVRFGIFSLAGGLPRDETHKVTLEPNASTPLGTFPRAKWERVGLKTSGAFGVLLDGGKPIAQHRLFLERFKDLSFAEPRIEPTVADRALTLMSDAFVWGLCLDVDGEAPLADNCFDLLPGIPYVLPWEPGLGAPRFVRLGNRDAVQ